MPSFYSLYNIDLSLMDVGEWTYVNNHTEASIFSLEILNINRTDPTKGYLNTYLQVREYFPFLEGGIADSKVTNVFPSIKDKQFKIEIPNTLIAIVPRVLQFRCLPKKGNRFRGHIRSNFLGGQTIEGYIGNFYNAIDKFDLIVKEWR